MTQGKKNMAHKKNPINDEQNRRLREIYARLESKYASPEWKDEAKQRMIVIYSIERTFEKNLEPDKIVMSKPFTL